MATEKMNIAIEVKPFFRKHPFILLLAIKLGLFKYCIKLKLKGIE